MTTKKNEKNKLEEKTDRRTSSCDVFVEKKNNNICFIIILKMGGQNDFLHILYQPSWSAMDWKSNKKKRTKRYVLEAAAALRSLVELAKKMMVGFEWMDIIKS